MQTGWMPLTSALTAGELILTDQSIWLDPLGEFGMDCRISSPVAARLTLLPQKEGLVVRGQLTGQVLLPCKLCAEDAQVALRRDFDEFEPFPSLESGTDEDEALEVDAYFIRWSPALILNRRPGRKDAAPRTNAKGKIFSGTQDWNGLEINPGNLAWEEFIQSLPQFPLCRKDCAGLCPHCGHNLNQGACGCKLEKADPRLEKLRGLKVLK